jgi:chemotaxis response regulator CheB
MGGDGALGLAELKRAGGFAIAQDEETSVVWGMPGVAVRAEVIDEVVPLQKIAGRVTEWVNQ